jgi:hypothetical protein
MDRRLQLQTLLSGLPGVAIAYHQAPPADKMEYPCIVYSLDNMDSSFANNNPYRSIKRYQVTVIDRNPDSLIPDAVASLPMSSFATRFVANNLNHSVFNLYF